MSLSFIAQRVFNTPLLVDPSKGHAILSGLGARLVDGRLRLPALEAPEERIARAGRIEPRASILGGDLSERYRAWDRRMYGMRDGIAVIEITGTLVHRGEWIGESSGVTSYEGIDSQIQAAAADPHVRGIALEIDTFGGEVAGAFDLADAIRSAREAKPVRAFVAEAALSAGYAIASQADWIVLPRTGEVGSIGVLVVHADYSQRLSDEGVAVSLIHAGAHKVDGNPYEPLPEGVRDELQEEAESLRGLFLETVAAGRSGRLSMAAAGATEARVYRGRRAVDLGLADEVSDLRAAFADFLSNVSRRRVAVGTTVAAASGSTEEAIMAATEKTKPGAEGQPDHEQAPAAPAERKPEQAPGQEPNPAPNPEHGPGETPEPKDGGDAEASARSGAASATISRAEAAAVAEVASHAARLGVRVDVAQAIRDGTSADALRARVLEQAAARSDATGIAAVQPAHTQPKESPVVAAARRAAEAAAQRRR
jgi:capsid assembly protease